MRNFKRFVAFVLCAVMLVGLVPMAFENAKVTAETVFDGVVQGANDAVVFVAPQTDSNLRGARLAAYYNRLIDNFVTTG
ncbi:MAG: hypothetical protein IIX09_03520, partial [Clostridia bacterium]|nr:hypothetical protein [Clostridia bacterium]